MAQRDVREYDCKKMFNDAWSKFFDDDLKFQFESVLVHSGKELKTAAKKNSWINEKSLVVKPDMLFGKRAKNNLVYLKDTKIGDIDLAKASKWIDQKTTETTTLDSKVKGTLDTFIVEPFVPHKSDEEFYISAVTEDEHDILYLSKQGGINIEDNWDAVTKISIPLNLTDSEINPFIKNEISENLDTSETVSTFISQFYQFFKAYHFTYLEINPIVFQKEKVFFLDAVSKLDDTAKFLMSDAWGDIDFHTAFGATSLTEEEKFIKSLDEKSGASLKLTILNPKGRLWTLVAGGGASVVYADTIADSWGASELANYGEYSGNPSTEETYLYTKTILDLMTREKQADNQSKVLIIGGAIANFTDVSKTFDGIIKAFEEYAPKMRKIGINIFVRRGGPNYEIGLKKIHQTAMALDLPIDVHGPKTHLTDIVRLAQKV